MFTPIDKKENNQMFTPIDKKKKINILFCQFLQISCVLKRFSKQITLLICL
jgi:hypothetical protein